MEMTFVIEGMVYKPKNLKVLQKNEIEYNLIYPLCVKLTEKTDRDLVEDMALKGCICRLREIDSQVNTINWVSKTAPKKKTGNTPKKKNENLTCAVNTVGFSSKDNIVISAKFTKGAVDKMVVIYEVNVNDIDLNGRCLVTSRNEIKGNYRFDFDRCKPLLVKALEEYDWCLDESIINWK